MMMRIAMTMRKENWTDDDTLMATVPARKGRTKQNESRESEGKIVCGCV
jgi:hypothetical protein